jgi:hypothetical protein
MSRIWEIMLADVFDDMGISHSAGKYRTVSVDDYDIKPKKPLVERQLAQLEEELKRTQTLKELTLNRYTEDEKRLLDKITNKKKELKDL